MSKPSVKHELSRLLNDERLKTLLHLLEADWPAAVQVVPLGMKAVGGQDRTEDCLNVLKEALRSYQGCLGKPDRQRLKAFISPLLDGFSALIAANPLQVQVLSNLLRPVTTGAATYEPIKVRVLLVELLMPANTSLGRVWRVINKV